MKKSCCGCKADGEFGCSLGFKQARKTIENVTYYGTIHFPIPAEDCPKPTTFKKLVELRLAK